MRVLYVTSDRMDVTAAASVHITGTTQAMTALGHEVGLVHTASRPGARLDAPWFGQTWPVWGPPVRGGARLYDHILCRRLPGIVERYDPDVVYFRHRPSSGLTRLLQRTDVPKVLELNGPTRPDDSRLHAFAGAMELVLADSEPMAAVLRDRWPRLAHRIQTHLTHVVDADAFVPADRSRARETLGMSSRARVLVHVSGFQPHHDFAMLVRATRRLASQDPDFIAVLAGDGPLFSRVKADLADLRQEGRVLMPGRIDRETVRDFITASDVCVDAMTPNALQVGNLRGMKVYEYMASARPSVVAVDYGQPVEPWAPLLLHPVRAGDPDAFASVVSDVLAAPDEAAERALAARAFVVAERSWKAATATTLAHLTSLLGTPESPTP